MAGAAHFLSICDELLPRHDVVCDCDEAQSHHENHPVAQRRGGAARLLLHQNVDKVAGEVRAPQAAIHQAGEHRHPDMCRRLLRHCLQWLKMQKPTMLVGKGLMI
ncbi:unnamed protein product [Victoria cruziana]